MADKINKYKNDKKMLSKSMINSQFKKEYPVFSKIPLSEIKKEFEEEKGEHVLVGSPYDKNKQKFVKYVSKDKFTRTLFQKYFRNSRKK